MITFLAIMGYGVGIGVAVQAIKSRSGDPNWDWIEHPEIMLSLFWVIMLPAFVGMAITSLVAPTGMTRLERRQAKEIEMAEHKAKLARIAREEDEELDRRLAAIERKMK